MSQQVKVEISSAYVREGANGKFVSLNVRDSGEAGFVALPEMSTEVSFVTYSVSTEIWAELMKISEAKMKEVNPKAKWSVETDSAKNKYYSTKSSDLVVQLEIELSRSLTVKSTGSGRKSVDTLGISGDVTAITVRGRRAGNGLKLS